MWSPRRLAADTNPGRENNRRWPDSVTLLTVYLMLIVAVPSRLTIAPLGAAGTPALLVGLVAIVWWMYYEIQRMDTDFVGPQPVRTMYVLVACAFLASYVAAMTRPIDAAESSAADLGVVVTAGWGGVLLLANDGIASMERFNVLLRRICFAGGALATLGIVQFATGTSFADRIQIPGLRANISLGSVALRSGFNRPSGTAIHPIEFGSVICMILPIALTLALNDRSRNWLRRYFPVAAIGMAAAMSISRSALIAAVVALVLVSMSWTPQRRLLGAAAVTVFGGIVFMTVPGLIGSLTGLFTTIGDDSSAASRSGSYPIASEFISRAPFFGRGLFTFLPRYRILDNQYLGLLIEVGFVGVALFLGLIVAAMMCARAVRRHSDDDYMQQVAQSLVASVAAGAVGLALFDGFSFPMSTGLFFLILGVAGGLWRLEREGPEPALSGQPAQPHSTTGGGATPSTRAPADAGSAAPEREAPRRFPSSRGRSGTSRAARRERSTPTRQDVDAGAHRGGHG